MEKWCACAHSRILAVFAVAFCLRAALFSYRARSACSFVAFSVVGSAFLQQVERPLRLDGFREFVFCGSSDSYAFRASPVNSSSWLVLMLVSFINLVHLVNFSALVPSARSVIASSSRASFHGLI